MKKALFQIFILCVAFAVAGCESEPKGNLPGISATIPVYPGAEIQESFTVKSSRSVPSNKLFRLHTVTLNTDAQTIAILEFYKNALSNMKIADYGGYFSIYYNPPDLKKGGLIEIILPKTQTGQGEGYYEVVEHKEL